MNMQRISFFLHEDCFICSFASRFHLDNEIQSGMKFMFTHCNALSDEKASSV